MTRGERIKKAKNHQLNCYLGAAVMGFLAGIILATTLLRAKREVPQEPIVQEVKAIEPEPTLTQEQEVEKEIRAVFGEYSDKAFVILRGKGSGTCAENRNLNPEAINDNTEWGGVGRDWGIFQINDHWQGVTNKAFLTDYKINIRMAWRIFENSGYSFKLWTCGKVYKI